MRVDGTCPAWGARTAPEVAAAPGVAAAEAAGAGTAVVEDAGSGTVGRGGEGTVAAAALEADDPTAGVADAATEEAKASRA